MGAAEHEIRPSAAAAPTARSPVAPRGSGREPQCEKWDSSQEDYDPSSADVSSIRNCRVEGVSALKWGRTRTQLGDFSQIFRGMRALLAVLFVKSGTPLEQ